MEFSDGSGHDTDRQPVSQINTLDLLALPDIRIKDEEVSAKLCKAIDIFEEKTGSRIVGDNYLEKLEHVKQENSSGNNYIFYILEKENDVIGVVKIINDKKKLADGTTRFDREVAAHNFIEPTIPNEATVKVPRLISADKDSQTIIMEYAPGNLDPKDSQEYLLKVIESLSFFSTIKPTKENIEKFPYNQQTPIETPQDYLDFQSKRIIEISERIADPNFDNVDPTQVHLYRSMFKQIEESGHLEKMQEYYENINKRLSATDVLDKKIPLMSRSFSPGDAGNANLRFSQKNGVQSIYSLDFEYASLYEDPLFFASLFIHHPQNRDIFGHNPQQTMNSFITEYIHRRKLGSDEIDRLNAFLPMVQMGWIVSKMRLITDISSGYKQIYGGKLQNWPEYVIKKEIPELEEMLQADPFQVQYNKGSEPLIIPGKERLKKLIHPLTGRPPLTLHERKVAEIIENPKEHMKSVNSELREAGLIEFSPEEVFGLYTMGKTISVENLGNGIYMVVSEYWPPDPSQREPLVRSWLTKDTKTMEENNGLFVIFDDAQNVNPQELEGEEVSSYLIDPQLVDNLVNKSKHPERFRYLAPALKKFDGSTNQPKSIIIKNIELVENEVESFGSHESIYVLIDENNNKFPYTANRIGTQQAEGSGYMLITEGGKWRMELNTRIFTLPHASQKGGIKENVEAGRAYEFSPKTIAEEYHLATNEIQIVGHTPLAADISSEAINVTSLLLKTNIGNKYPPNFEAKPDIVNLDTGPEIFNQVSGPQEIRYIDLSGKEILELIRRGIIRDEATIAMIAAFMTRYTKELTLKDEFKKGGENPKVAYMREVIAPHEGGRVRRVVPSGNINAGIRINEFEHNSGTWRDDFHARLTSLKEYKKTRKTNEKLFAVKVEDIFNGFGRGEFDQTSTAALFIGMLEADMFNYNDVDLKNWPPKTKIPAAAS